MKLFHRIRCRCPILLLFLLHFAVGAYPPNPDFSKCGVDTSLLCIVHTKACDVHGKDKDRYAAADHDEIKPDCKRYMFVRAINIEQLEIEFRDKTIPKSKGVEFTRTKTLLKCTNNAVSSSVANLNVKSDSQAPNYDELYCKFDLTSNTADKNIINELNNNNLPNAIKDSSGNSIQLTGLEVQNLLFKCDWSAALFGANIGEPEENEETMALQQVEQGKQMICAKGYFNKYKDPNENEYSMIGDFSCDQGKIGFAYTENPSKTFEPHLISGMTKCTRPKCSACACPNCVPAPSLPATNCTKDPHFTATDGKSCSVITCPNCKAMQIETGSGPLIHPDNTMTCGLKKKWADFESVKSVTCLDEVRCTEFHPIQSLCPATLPEDKTCNRTALNDKGNVVCAGMETWFTPKGRDDPRRVFNFSCDTTTGRWHGTNEKNDSVFIEENSTVYCLKQREDPPPAPQQGGVGAGTLIGFIVAGGVVVAIIVAVVVICLKRALRKKGNRDEMKSVSVTGRGDKKSKKSKKGSKSSYTSKTSMTSEISVPPPPPCPDSLSYNVEPDLPARQPASGGPSSGEGKPVVGPDTGKPDKPAELIDISMSEKKNTESRKDDTKTGERTNVKTVTGTDSKAEPARKKNSTQTDSMKKNKNGDSARSDTGKMTKEEKKKRMKDKKLTLDKNGRGLTDDDDYNIDEGAKPVKAEDKNKNKPYKPAIDPRKKMINVTMTEDEDGNVRPKSKKSAPLF